MTGNTTTRVHDGNRLMQEDKESLVGTKCRAAIANYVRATSEPRAGPSPLTTDSKSSSSKEPKLLRLSLVRVNEISDGPEEAVCRSERNDIEDDGRETKSPSSEEGARAVNERDGIAGENAEGAIGEFGDDILSSGWTGEVKAGILCAGRLGEETPEEGSRP